MFTICRLLVALLALTAAASPIEGQQQRPKRVRPTTQSPPTRTTPEVSQVAAGWLLMAEGQFAHAAARAQQVLATNPRNPAALHLAVEAALASGGAGAALRRYEQVLGRRGLDEPAPLRVVAIAVLKEAAYGPGGGAARIEALKALVQAGDAAARDALARMAAEGGAGELRALASAGDEAAVRRLAADLQKGTAGNETATLEALGRSGSPLAAEAIAPLLRDRRPEVRGAAAEALGLLGQPELADRLKPLLADSSSFVRVRAAASLYQIGDYSGDALLRELLVSESDVSRLIAAEAMAARPDGSWLAIVRELTASQEPEVRLGAARLMAPHDPQLARDVLDRLVAEADLSIGELAGQASADLPSSDVGTLRQQLAAAAPLVRVRAASRLVALTE